MSDERDRDGTVCPFCAVGCRLTHDGERVRGVVGPANPQGRLCEKGLRAFDSVDADERLTAPLVRRDGDLVSVSWDTAIDHVVDAFEEIIGEHGPNALAFLGAPRCTNEENYLLQKLARMVGTNNVDNRARICHTETARVLNSRLGYPAMTNSLADLREADVFLVVGANPAARQPVAFNSAVRPALNENATLIHIDPYENETTRHADWHVTPRPGTDALVITALCAFVAEAGGIDESFISSRTTGFEAFHASLDERDVAADLVAADVDEERVRDLAKTIAAADRTTVLTGTGADETATADALLNLLSLTGNLGRRGTGLNVLRGLNNEQGATDMGCVPDWLPGHRPVTDESARVDITDEWGVVPPSRAGDTEHELVADFGNGIAGALVVGENPAISKRDPQWIEEQLNALDMLVVHELFRSKTATHADVVLPVATAVEKEGTITNLDRQVQRLSPVTRPPETVRTDFEILREFGRHLVGAEFDYATPRDVFDEITRVTPPYAQLSYATLTEQSRRWPAGETSDCETEFLYAESFATDDNRTAFVMPDLPSAKNTDDRSLHLVVGDRVQEFTVDSQTETDQRLIIHPADAETRNIENGSPVLVTNDEAAVETRATVSEAVRTETVYLHATIADPLVRGEDPTVKVRPEENSS